MLRQRMVLSSPPVWSDPLFVDFLTETPTFNLVFSFCNGHSGWQEDQQRSPKLFLTSTSTIFGIRLQMHFCDIFATLTYKSLDLLSRLTHIHQQRSRHKMGRPQGTLKGPQMAPKGLQKVLPAEKLQKDWWSAQKWPGKSLIWERPETLDKVGDGVGQRTAWYNKKPLNIFETTTEGISLAVSSLSTFCF